MAYHWRTDSYECEWCGAEIGRFVFAPVHGFAWQCEKCGKTFCQACFKYVHGNEGLRKMILPGYKPILCPDCFVECETQGCNDCSIKNCTVRTLKELI